MVKSGLEGAKYGVPRIAEGKYLKLLYEVFMEKRMLDDTMDDIKEKVCPRCDIKTLCVREKSVEKLSPLCLDGIATICFRS